MLLRPFQNELKRDKRTENPDRKSVNLTENLRKSSDLSLPEARVSAPQDPRTSGLGLGGTGPRLPLEEFGRPDVGFRFCGRQTPLGFRASPNPVTEANGAAV